MLLGCGTEDNYTWAFICKATQDMAANMINTPGKALFLKDTGHSIHSERPNYWSRQILEFFGMPLQSSASLAVPPPRPTVLP